MSELELAIEEFKNAVFKEIEPTMIKILNFISKIITKVEKCLIQKDMK